MASGPCSQTLHDLLDEHKDTPTMRIATALLVRQGVPKQTIADAFGVSLRTVYNWVERFDSLPIEEAPFDAQRTGAPRSLNEEQRRELFAAFRVPPSDHGQSDASWTPRLAQQYIEEEFGVSYSRRHASRLLAHATAKEN